MKKIFSTINRVRVYPNLWDIMALMLVLAVIVAFAWGASQMSTPYHVGQVLPVSLDVSHLPDYALRTVLRMFIALGFSLLFTFILGTWAAKSRYAERLIIPLVDILQSVPVLGFLSVAIIPLIALFPGSLIGPECAAIFAVFTSQAWNMILGFYQTLRAVPGELLEAADMFHLSAWQRFWRIEVPFSMPSLLWNMMISMSASWFFVVASEAITVSNQSIMLPGIGSYIGVAIGQRDGWAVGYAIFAMLIVIFLYDQLLFRPLMAWSEKFRAAEESSDERYTGSWLATLFQRTRLIQKIGVVFEIIADVFVNLRLFAARKTSVRAEYNEKRSFWTNIIWNIILFAMITATGVILYHFIFQTVSIHEGVTVLYDGLITALRIFVLIILASLLWVPIGVWIGLRPGLSKLAQPIVQFLAAFPAYVLFPAVVYLIVHFNLNVQIWTSPLMILGAQWYILFNVIAGASALPRELQQAADNFNLTGWLRWKRLFLPAIFPYYITGAIAAAGGAWNASIVAEVVDWGNTHLVATGLGAYIYEYTQTGDFPRIALGIGVMCIYVLILNRLLWHPLYMLAETRYKMN